MRVIKHADASQDVMPLLAALPYAVIAEEVEVVPEASFYDPTRQRTVYAGRRDYSTCREDESTGITDWKTRSDTKRDD